MVDGREVEGRGEHGWGFWGVGFLGVLMGCDEGCESVDSYLMVR